MRGSNHTCAISDAWTWSFICPEVKAGLTTHHPQITKPSHHRISHWKRPEGSPLPGPVTTIRGHGGCGPRSRKNYKNCSYPRHPAQDSNKHCQDNFMLGLPDTAESREAKVKMLYRFWMELSGNFFCVTKKKKKSLLIYQLFGTLINTCVFLNTSGYAFTIHSPVHNQFTMYFYLGC